MDRRLRQIYEVFDEMMKALEERERILKELISLADEKIAELRAVVDKESGREDDFLAQPKAKEVISLYKAGKKIGEISEMTGVHKGEVELILNLYRIKYESSASI